MKNDLFIIFLKVLAYAIGLLLAYFGATVLVSCSMSHYIDAQGKSTIISTDTTVINHKGYINFPRK